MCDPVSVTIGATAGSALLGAYDSHQQGKEASAAATANAQIADRQASDALARGAREAGIARMQGTGEESAARAAMAASGVDLSSATAAAVQATNRLWSNLDSSTIENNARREALGLKMEAANYRSQASQARRRGNLGAVGSILGGVTRAGGMAYDNYQGTKNTKR